MTSSTSARDRKGNALNRAGSVAPEAWGGRRDLLKAGFAATGALLLPAHLARAQDATPAATPAALTEEEQNWLSQASRQDSNGWIHLRIGGAPFARGFQHGYLTAAEYADALRVYETMTYQTMGFEYAFFVEKAVEYHKDKITPELLEEMSGIAAGYT
ncbi:MAG: hypothetical protein M3Z20_11880, partial [Chloroflexota bacterium]|nr:hypothetical protein [Chloroflexota bacterium]